MAPQASKLLLTGKATLNSLIHLLLTKVLQLISPKEPAEYKAWRNKFMWRRIRFFLWGALACLCACTVFDFYSWFYLKQREASWVIGDLIQMSLLLSCLIVHRTKFGHRYPGVLFLCLCSVTSIVSLNAGSWTLMFLALATVIPVCWWLHLMAQLSTLVYWWVVNQPNVFTQTKGNSFDIIILFLYLFLFCSICNVGVYLHERLQRAEFESRRELRVFLHAISHDLRTPLMGNAIVLNNLLKKSDSQVSVSASVLERLLEGNSRQINLLNLLQEAYSLEVRGVVLHCEPVQLTTVVTSVLNDLEPYITQNRVIVNNLVQVNLPLVNADAIQLGRVFSNLISNALKHNPHEITLTLDAIAKGKKILCRVQDNGVGMSKQQCSRVFELYTRGENARFMPGLGLGLYVCQQIVTAHGGKIGVTSVPGTGSTFWFTLPLYQPIT